MKHVILVILMLGIIWVPSHGHIKHHGKPPVIPANLVYNVPPASLGG